MRAITTTIATLLPALVLPLAALAMCETPARNKTGKTGTVTIGHTEIFDALHYIPAGSKSLTLGPNQSGNMNLELGCGTYRAQPFELKVDGRTVLSFSSRPIGVADSVEVHCDHVYFRSSMGGFFSARKEYTVFCQ